MLFLLQVPLLAEESSTTPNLDRSPVDLVLSPDESWIATANQSSGTVSLVRATDGVVLDEVEVGERPVAITLHPDGQTLLVSASYSGEVIRLKVDGDAIATVSRIPVGHEPYGIAVDHRGEKAYVALSAEAKVALIDLASNQVEDWIDVGRWPRYLAISPDDSRLAVGTSGDRGISVVDLDERRLAFIEQFVGLNIGHLQISSNGKHVYFPWVIYRRNPITPGNIRLGWVLATRIARVRMDQRARREAMSLDPRGEAIADPHGLALTSDEQRLVVSASGSQELLVYRAADLPLEDFGGTDHLPQELLQDPKRFRRIPLGGRPMGLRIGKDDRTVYVTNYLLNSIQVVDLATGQVGRSIDLGGPSTPSLARQGEAIFYDGRRSLDQWYSCHTCHYDGGTNAVVMDTMNDESTFTFKTVLPLFHVDQTAPWTWHGWQTDLRAAMHKSITSTMQGPSPSEHDVDALIAYLQSLQPPPRPRPPDDVDSQQSYLRGKALFHSERAGCATCHRAETHFSDGQIHDVGLASKRDQLEGFNTPSLLGVHRKVLWLHDGRAKSLADLLNGPHSPAKVSGTASLSEQEVNDLIAYLRSL